MRIRLNLGLCNHIIIIINPKTTSDLYSTNLLHSFKLYAVLLYFAIIIYIPAIIINALISPLIAWPPEVLPALP